jgi:hypothetical protein
VLAIVLAIAGLAKHLGHPDHRRRHRDAPAAAAGQGAWLQRDAGLSVQPAATGG